jgi:hypothetical protein
MDQLFALQNRLMRTWLQACEVQAATIATISARLPIIAAASSGFGDSHAQRETQVMLTEKLDAASEGAEAGMLETAKWTLKVMMGRSHVGDVADRMMDVAAAATRPARHRVLANAQRLAAR